MHNLKELIREVLLTNSIKPDCGCGCKGTTKCFEAPILNENLKARIVMTENMQYHIDAKKPLFETTLPYGSKEYLNLWAEARYLYSRGALNVEGIDKEKITETHLGEYGMYEGKKVPLDLPMLDEDDILNEAEYRGRKVQLGKPMQGDVKKFKVYVKNPAGNVVKVNFGQKGMKIRKSNPAARKSFRARMNCDSPGPRHKANYWSCRKW
jgi:hypothetical protein